MVLDTHSSHNNPADNVANTANFGDSLWCSRLGCLLQARRLHHKTATIVAPPLLGWGLAGTEAGALRLFEPSYFDLHRRELFPHEVFGPLNEL
jgi:hypothetical protein